MQTEQIDFMEIDGIAVGHAQDLAAATGCTVMICEDGAAVGVDAKVGALVAVNCLGDILDPAAGTPGEFPALLDHD